MIGKDKKYEGTILTKKILEETQKEQELRDEQKIGWIWIVQNIFLFLHFALCYYFQF